MCQKIQKITNASLHQVIRVADCSIGILATNSKQGEHNEVTWVQCLLRLFFLSKRISICHYLHCSLYTQEQKHLDFVYIFFPILLFLSLFIIFLMQNVFFSYAILQNEHEHRMMETQLV